MDPKKPRATPKADRPRPGDLKSQVSVGHPVCHLEFQDAGVALKCKTHEVRMGKN